jgi:Ser/Thr protein kinase RdoA (MazF antagonist)
MTATFAMYLVCQHGRHILIVYRMATDRRGDSRRVAVCGLLVRNQVPVPTAVAKKTGGQILSFSAPEGIRYGVLTTYAPGQHLHIRANALVADDGAVTVIDFDWAGLGWRAYDVASYLLTIRGDPQEPNFEEAF